MKDATRTQTTTPDSPERHASATPTHAPSTCCGGPAPVGAEACCARDAEVKSAGGAGCGCGSAPSPAAPGVETPGCCGHA
jgi:hypothetical protein